MSAKESSIELSAGHLGGGQDVPVRACLDDDARLKGGMQGVSEQRLIYILTLYPCY